MPKKSILENYFFFIRNLAYLILGNKVFQKLKISKNVHNKKGSLKPIFLLFDLPKGQLISKGLFGFFNSPKKRTKNFCSSRLGQKLTFSSSFFGRIEDTKISFRD